jgi:hypothetical protein
MHALVHGLHGLAEPTEEKQTDLKHKTSDTSPIETLEKLMALLQSAPVERNRFVSHPYQSRREYRRTCQTAGKSGKQIGRCVISTFQIAQRMGL